MGLMLCYTSLPSASEAPSAWEIKEKAKYSKKGADTCLKCHDDEKEYPASAIFKSYHAVKGDKRTPFGQLQCETCHGPAGEHTVKRVRKGQTREEMIKFKTGSSVPVEQRNEVCTSCHQKQDKSHWQGNTHQINDVACHDCHQIHAEKNDIRESKNLQVEVCGKCHQDKKLAANRFSTHPIKYGQQMGCSDCHSLHDSDNDQLLAKASINDTCYQCHAEKRGPFLWEHEPASENCALCHSPHGSNNKAMLTSRAPVLCQNCHSSEGHPSIANGSSSLSSNLLLGRSCANCHSKVHGSNHPSGHLLHR